MNERISFPLNRKSDATVRNKIYSFKIYFHGMEKLLQVERILEELEQNGKKLVSSPLAIMKDLFQKYISNVWKTDKIMAYTRICFY